MMHRLFSSTKATNAKYKCFWCSNTILGRKINQVNFQDKTTRSKLRELLGATITFPKGADHHVCTTCATLFQNGTKLLLQLKPVLSELKKRAHSEPLNYKPGKRRRKNPVGHLLSKCFQDSVVQFRSDDIIAGYEDTSEFRGDVEPFMTESNLPLTPMMSGTVFVEPMDAAENSYSSLDTFVKIEIDTSVVDNENPDASCDSSRLGTAETEPKESLREVKSESEPPDELWASEPEFMSPPELPLCEVEFETYDEAVALNPAESLSKVEEPVPSSSSAVHRTQTVQPTGIESVGVKYECVSVDETAKYGNDSKKQLEEIRPFKCQICSESFQSKPQRSEHQRIHIISTNGREDYWCHHCETKFQKFAEIVDHMHVWHVMANDPGGFAEERICRDCNIIFKDVDTLRDHYQIAHNSTPSKSGSILVVKPKNYDCKVCGKIYLTLHYLRRHMKSQGHALGEDEA